MNFTVFLLGLVCFVTTTAEFMVAGMMPSLAKALGVSHEDIGYLISLYALGMTVGGPALLIITSLFKTSDKTALLIILALYVLGATVSASSSTYTGVAAGRIIMGVSSSACFGICMTICVRLVEPELYGKASSLVLAGIMISPVIGVPSTAFIEQLYGWRTSFWVVAFLPFLCLIFVAWRVPFFTNESNFEMRNEIRNLSRRKLWAAYLTSACIIGSNFSVFSYIHPILTQVSGVASEKIPFIIMAYGLCNIVGNFITGIYASKYTMIVLATGLCTMFLSLACFILFSENFIICIMAFLFLGFTGVALNPAMSVRVMRAAEPRSLVNTLHVSMITTGLSFGTWAGGKGIALGFGLMFPIWVGLVLSFIGILSLLPYINPHSNKYVAVNKIWPRL